MPERGVSRSAFRGTKMDDVSWSRYEGKALADPALAGGALHAALEDYIRVRNPHLTDVRADQATATEEYDTGATPPRRWYQVTYLADDGQGH
jgi:hypothetical protein